jgi:hypothetical protein
MRHSMFRNYSQTLTVFDQSLDLIWEKTKSDSLHQGIRYECSDKHFYLSISGVARFWAFPEKNQIKIELIDEKVEPSVLNAWLFGTIMAYVLQYRGYHVLHGAAILMQKGVVILSGHSGAGKSTLAAAMMQKGHQLLSDDLAVIQPTSDGHYSLIPGPSILKLCRDSMQQFHYEPNQGKPLFIKSDKYVIPVAQEPKKNPLPIKAFYEICMGPSTQTMPIFHTFSKGEALKTLIHHAYRYFMIKPLAKLQYFMNACRDLVEKIDVHQIQRPANYQNLPTIIQHIEQEQGM